MHTSQHSVPGHMHGKLSTGQRRLPRKSPQACCRQQLSSPAAAERIPDGGGVNVETDGVIEGFPDGTAVDGDRVGTVDGNREGKEDGNGDEAAEGTAEGTARAELVRLSTLELLPDEAWIAVLKELMNVVSSAILSNMEASAT